MEDEVAPTTSPETSNTVASTSGSHASLTAPPSGTVPHWA